MTFTFYRSRNHWLANDAIVTLTLASLAEAKRMAEDICAGTITSKRGIWANVLGEQWVKS